MQVELNSVWQFDSVDGFNDGLYRVLAIFPEQSLFIIFPLIDSKSLVKPSTIEHAVFFELNKKKFITKGSFEIPFYVDVSDASPDKYLIKRNEQYALISELVKDRFYLIDIVDNKRSKHLVEHARSLNTYVQKIYRILNTYWRYGQTRDALIPAYRLSGGSGKTRKSGSNKRGRPIPFKSFCMETLEGVNTTEKDKKIFIKAMKKIGLKGKKVTYRYVYEEMLNEYYADEVIAAEEQNIPPQIPTYRNFVYWIKKLIPAEERIQKQTNQGDFERNLRGLKGAATDHTSVIGSCFELDATVLDVHVVSEFQRNKVLGRPTFYCVVDKESRMIVGIHVSMEYASWRAGRQALVNSFTSKKEYCARFGVDISESGWPCHHIPQRLLCDRGEFICNDAEKLAVPLIGHLSFAPPYRADRKGIVEHRFKILNDALLHHLIGTTGGRQYVRGDKDPRLEAALTLTEVTKMLIQDVIAHNNRMFFALSRQSTLLIENDLKPTPLNYWNIHLIQHRHALSHVDEASIRARLLPEESVSMTSQGLRLNEFMYYESQHPDFEDWKVLARKSQWKLEARLDQDNSSFIFVRFNENEPFMKCHLMKMSSTLSNRHTADILYYEDWNKLQKSKGNQGKGSVAKQKNRKEIIANAKEKQKNTPSLKSKKEKISNMKERRREAINENRLKSDYSELADVEVESNCQIDSIKQKKSNVVSMMKRKKK